MQREEFFKKELRKLGLPEDNSSIMQVMQYAYYMGVACGIERPETAKIIYDQTREVHNLPIK